MEIEVYQIAIPQSTIEPLNNHLKKPNVISYN